MHQAVRLFTVAAAIAVAGCASSPRTTSDGKPATQAAVERIAPPVTVPNSSTHKVVLAMSGAKIAVESKDWVEFKREWRETFAEHAKNANVAFTFVDGDAQPTGEDGTILQVYVNDYRIVGIGMRIMFGIMTGNAFIDAKVRFQNLKDGMPFGEQQYNTTSSAGAGVFAKVTPQQVDAIAYNIFRDIKSTK